MKSNIINSITIVIIAVGLVISSYLQFSTIATLSQAVQSISYALQAHFWYEHNIDLHQDTLKP